MERQQENKQSSYLKCSFHENVHQTLTEIN